MSGFSRGLRRVVAYGLALPVIFSLYRGGVGMHTVDALEHCSTAVAYPGAPQSSLAYSQRLSLCMFLRSNYLEARRMEPALRAVMALPSSPCARVGQWRATRARSVYRVDLEDDGRFTAHAVVNTLGQAEDVRGFWGEHQGQMVWVYDSGPIWPPDINRIEQDSPGRFTLIEANRERTEYLLEQKPSHGRCAL